MTGTELRDYCIKEAAAEWRDSITAADLDYAMVFADLDYANSWQAAASSKRKAANIYSDLVAWLSNQ